MKGKKDKEPAYCCHMGNGTEMNRNKEIETFIIEVQF